MLSRADSDATVSMTETRKNGAHMEKKKKKYHYLPRELRYVRTNDSDLEKISRGHSTKEI